MSVPTDSVRSLAELGDEQIAKSRWYYQVELRPGVYTEAREHHTAAMVRSLVERIDLGGARCLDVGAQEGLVSVALARLGAESVVSYDRLDLRARIGLVQEAYGVELDYRHSMLLSELPDALARDRLAPFDVVVFAGVLYHMIDPLGGLGTVRGFVRENGLVIVETAAVVSDEMVLYFNAAGRLQEGSTYFLPSLSWLDYSLRMLHLEPIDCLHIAQPTKGTQGRVAIVCRALKEPLAYPDDAWMGKHWVRKDFSAVQLDYAALRSAAPAVGYASEGQLQLHPKTGSVDLFRSVRESEAARFVRDPKKARLNLADYEYGRAS